LQIITLIDRVGMTPLQEGSVRRRDICLKRNKRSQKTEIYFVGWIRTCSTTKQDAADLRQRLSGRCDRAKQMWLKRN